MSYKHILVAVDLTESSELVVNKAVALAKATGAKVSLIYVDVDFADKYTALSYSECARFEADRERSNSLEKELQALATKTDYAIEETIFVNGDLNANINETVQKLHADLLVCGHHHDFWSRLLSSIRKLVNSTLSDLLIIHI